MPVLFVNLSRHWSDKDKQLDLLLLLQTISGWFVVCYLILKLFLWILRLYSWNIFHKCSIPPFRYYRVRCFPFLLPNRYKLFEKCLHYLCSCSRLIRMSIGSFKMFFYRTGEWVHLTTHSVLPLAGDERICTNR